MASQEEIDQLPTYMVRRVDGQQEGDIPPGERVLFQEDAECCICLSDYDDGEQLRELPCNHHFHSNCISHWLSTNPTCPLCKFDISSTEDNNQQDDNQEGDNQQDDNQEGDNQQDDNQEC